MKNTIQSNVQVMTCKYQLVLRALCWLPRQLNMAREKSTSIRLLKNMKHGGMTFVMNLKQTNLFNGLPLYPKIFDPIMAIEVYMNNESSPWDELMKFVSTPLKRRQSNMESWVSYHAVITMPQTAVSQHNNTVCAGHYLSFIKNLTEA